MKKAMIFAAGLGSRLSPLTDDRPKALIMLQGKTLLQRAVEKLAAAGVKLLVINVHHFSSLMYQAIEQLKYPGLQIAVSDESGQLLETGGGLVKAAGLLAGEEPFFLYNVDVISGIDLNSMYAYHQQNGALATLAVSRRTSTRYFLWEQKRLCGWQNEVSGDKVICFPVSSTPQKLAFSGIHVVSPQVLELITEKGRFSINKLYLRLAAKFPVMAYEHDATFWADVGTPEKLSKAEKMLKENPDKF